MSRSYKQSSHFAGATRFTKAPMVDVEYSRMTNDPTALVPMNAGDIVPVLYFETLPHSTYVLDFEHITRLLSAALRPTMGSLILDLYAFEVPNRVVNDSWRNIQGENTSDFWAVPEVELAPLYKNPETKIRIPEGSIADYYGFPTQNSINGEVLAQCNDLKFKGYLDIYNNYFRDENYQPPIPFSKLNLFQGFLSAKGTSIVYANNVAQGDNIVPANSPSDGSYSAGAITRALFGDGSTSGSVIQLNSHVTSWSALDKPLKANKLHDPFTSVLPSPQKGPEVSFNVSGELPVDFKLSSSFNDFAQSSSGYTGTLSLHLANYESGSGLLSYENYLGTNSSGNAQVYAGADLNAGESAGSNRIIGWNVQGTTDLADAVGVTINELRTAIATQQVYEQLARGGSRYWEFLKSFFGIETDNPFPDIPTQIGHYRTELDMFQVAQTSASQEGGSPQGSLSAFGYTAEGGALLRKTTIEYGYIHVLAVIRHRNLYSTYFAPDNLRRTTLDFYLPQFANISEQPIRKAILNPFADDAMEKAIGYQEYGWEYRYTPDTVVGQLRTGLDDSLDVWHYGDPFDANFDHVNGEWLISNTQEVLDRTLAITSELAPQFICAFTYKLTKQLPMPVYSVPGLDTI